MVIKKRLGNSFIFDLGCLFIAIKNCGAVWYDEWKATDIIYYLFNIESIEASKYRNKCVSIGLKVSNICIIFFMIVYFNINYFYKNNALL